MRSSPGSATTFSWRPHPADPEPARVGRDGMLALALERRGAATVLSRWSSALPLQMLAPVALDGPATVVSVLNPTGGLVGGDRLAIDAVVGAAAHGCLTTPSATKVYRTTGAAAGRVLRGIDGAVGGVGALPRRGAVVRCLAVSAPALTVALEALWTVARRELLGLPALALRKAW